MKVNKILYNEKTEKFYEYAFYVWLKDYKMSLSEISRRYGLCSKKMSDIYKKKLGENLLEFIMNFKKVIASFQLKYEKARDSKEHGSVTEAWKKALLDWHESGLTEHEFSLKNNYPHAKFVKRLFIHADEVFKDKGGLEYVYKVSLTRNILKFYENNKGLILDQDGYEHMEMMDSLIIHIDTIRRHNAYLKASGEIAKRYPVKGVPETEIKVENRFIPILNIKALRNHRNN